MNGDNLSDNFALDSMRKESTFDQITELYSKYRGMETFKARVISNGPDADTNLVGFNTVIKARTMIHDHCIPDPCNPNLTQEEVKRCKSLHPRCPSIRPYGEGDQPPRYAQTVELHYIKSGPNNNGKMRDARFVPEHKSVKYDYECVAGELIANETFDSQEAISLMQDLPSGNLDQTSSPSQLVSSVTNDDTVFLFGDSQMQNVITDPKPNQDTMGKLLQNSFKKGRDANQAKKVIKEGNGGWTAQKYLNKFNSKLKPHLQKKPKLIIIILGGNGVHPEAKYSLRLLEKISSVTPNSQIIWIGPPPPASDGTKYNKDGKLLVSRKERNQILKNKISDKVSRFIHSYEVSGFENGYSCSESCDGVHLPGEHAKRFLNNAGLLRS